MNSRGRRRFRRWVQSVGSQKSAARLVGCTQPTVSQLVSGRRSAGISIALRIRDATLKWKAGPIRPAEWSER